MGGGFPTFRVATLSLVFVGFEVGLSVRPYDLRFKIGCILIAVWT